MAGSRPKALSRSDRQDGAIIEATWAYYHDGLNQNEIATRLGVSRATVVNYLQEARRRNYVRISLDPDIFRQQRLARDLVTRLGLADALVVPAAPGTADNTLDRVVLSAGDWLQDLLEPGDHLGVAWGETIYRLAETVTPRVIDDLTVVQLVGSRPSSPGFTAEACSSMLAAQLGALCINLHVPLLVSDQSLAERLRQEPVVAEQLRAVETCTKTLFACGTCDSASHIARAGLIEPEDVAQYHARGACGVICGRMIDQSGTPVISRSEDRMIGVTLDQMRDKEMGIMVGAGADRVLPMLAAIRGGYATHLATDTETATALLEASA